MNRLLAIFQVLKKGYSVANPAAWKKGQITGSVLAGLIGSVIGLAKVYGYELPLTDDQIIAIGSAIVAIVGLFVTPVVTVASTDKIGLPSEPDAQTKAQQSLGH